mgnify:CR=1 FL=1
MIAQVQNVSFTFRRKIYGDYSGESYWEFCDKSIADLEEHLKDADRDDSDLGDFLSEFDDMCAWHNTGTHNTDLGLYLAAVLLELSGQYSVTYECSHIIWMFHDMAHLMYDTCTEWGVSVDDYSEERAIKTSIELLLENNISIPYEILAKTDEEVKERYGYTSNFMGYAEEMEVSSIVPSKELTLSALL